MSYHALGFDVGLSGVRATLVRKDGLLVARSRRPHARARLGDGRAEHDPRDWLDGIAAVGQETVAAADGVRIAAVGVAALGPAPVLVDEQLRPLTKALLFGLDRRAEPQRHRMVEHVAAPGTTVDNALPKLAWWLENEPELGGRAAWALDATGVVVGALTGVPVMDSITAGDYVMPGVQSPVPLPPVLDPLAVAGELMPRWATRLGCPAGLPVIAGTYDSFADIAGAGVRRPGDAGLVLGSTMIIGRAVDDGVDPPAGLASSAFPGEGGTLLGGWTLSGGLALDWFAERFGDDGDLARRAAEREPGGVLALPYLSGERTPLWDPHARGAFIGLTPDTGPAELYRALVDSLALAVLDHTERLERALGPCSVWRVTGGGTRHPLWVHATADALGATLAVAPNAAEGLGPALLALRTLGPAPDRPPAATVEPDGHSSERLRRLLPAFRDLSRQLSSIVHGLPASTAAEEPVR